MIRSNPKLIVIVAAMAITASALWPRTARTAQQAPVTHHAKIAARPPTPAKVELTAALEQRSIQVDFTGNGREKMRVTITNKSTQALRVHASEGQIFESGNNLVAAVRGCNVD